MSLNSMIFCHMCKKADTARDKGLTTPDNVARFNDIVYGKDNKWQVLDVYRPKDLPVPAPVIVSVHGGGWVYGDKDVYQYYCMDLASRGFAVINFSYRLAPKYKYPTAVEDTNLVFNWIFANSDKYKLDTGNIFAVGDSAGAQNLAIYACILTNPDYASKYSFKIPDDLRIIAMALNCGIYDMEVKKNISFCKDLLKEKGSEEELSLLSPAKYVTEDYPPCFIMTSNGDELKDQAPFMVEALKKNNVRHEYKIYGTDDNMLYHVFHCDIKSEDAKVTNDDECDFFRSLM